MKILNIIYPILCLIRIVKYFALLLNLQGCLLVGWKFFYICHCRFIVWLKIGEWFQLWILFSFTGTHRPLVSGIWHFLACWLSCHTIIVGNFNIDVRVLVGFWIQIAKLCCFNTRFRKRKAMFQILWNTMQVYECV